MIRSTGAPTVAAMVLDATARRQSGPALRFPADGTWHELDYPGLGRAVREIGAGLLVPGDRPRGPGRAARRAPAPSGRCATSARCASVRTVVPIYHTSSPEECRYVLEHSGARVLLCEDAEQLAKIRSARDRLPALEHVIAMADPGLGELSLADLRLRGAAGDLRAVDAAGAALAPDDLATIVYTSGTTGPPKGCELTHRNLMFTVAGVRGGARPRRGRAAGDLPLPPARARALARGRAGGARRRRHARVLERRHDPGRRRPRGDATDALPVGPARVREDPRARGVRGRREGRAQPRGVPSGDPDRAARPRAAGPRRARAASAARPPRRARAAGVLEGPVRVRRPPRAGADRRRADRPRGARVLRGGGGPGDGGLRHDRVDRRGHAEHPRRPPARDRGPRAAGHGGGDRRETARS